MIRLFDILIATLGLIATSPIWAVVAIAIKLTSRGPVIFRQERMGRDFHPFFILKFRTMVEDAPNCGAAITVGDDPRITKVGRLLRKTKLDEMPQLVNVLRGDMSLVGPRPEVGRYVEMFRDDYAEILRVPPGVTDLASIKYRDESSILAKAADPEEEYVRRVLPEKIRLAKEYVRRRSLPLNVSILFGTFVHLACDRAPRLRKGEALAEPVAPGESNDGKENVAAAPPHSH